MKNNYTIVLFLLFLSFQAWATTDTDSLTVGKRTRTFATATYRVAVKTSAARGVVSTKGVNSGGEIARTNVNRPQLTSADNLVNFIELGRRSKAQQF